MAEATESKVDLADLDRVRELFKRLEGSPQDIQAVMDLSFVTLFLAKFHGVPLESLTAAMGDQESLAAAYLLSLIAENTEGEVAEDA